MTHIMRNFFLADICILLYRRPSIRVPLTKNHVSFVRQYALKTPPPKNAALFTDESRFTPYYTDRKVKVWRRLNEHFLHQLISRN